MDLVKKTREFLKENKIDYLLVNSTNEFLVEYADLEENSRYLLTNFSGSTGDAVISQKNILLFVDGRYHEQADLEVDKNLVKVVKIKIGESFSACLAKKLLPNKTFGIVTQKVSQGRLEILEPELKKKNIEIKLLDFDPILGEQETGKRKQKIVQIELKISGLSADEKIKKITKNLKKDEAILVTNLEEISYLLNLRDFSKNYSSKIQSGKYLIIKNGGEFLEKVTDIKNIKNVYVDKTSINAYDYAQLGEKAANLKTNYIKEMKAVKTKAEIEHYKNCFKRTDKALLATRSYIEKNDIISEFDIAKILEENFYKFGAKSLSFKTIVAKDKNSAQAHYSKNSKSEILQDGSLILIDCGAYYEGGYATDCTRVFVKGKPSTLQKKVYTIVLKGFLAAFRKKITSKTTGFALDKTARKILDTNKPAGFEFSHSLGHGIGISVHESPPSLVFSPTAKTPLKPNMCFTIEPGLYNPKHFGVRLENSCYLVKERGDLVIKSFSNMCFEKKLIDFDMLTPTEKKQLKNFVCLL
ncbi:MAG: M24 family metallopeptidase [Candidatus Gastranaerophilales bacterium]|nr:M24 family metallopeptidase [Candidatus Gastranaerophilales bacterium]